MLTNACQSMVQCDILPYLRTTRRHHVVDEPPFLLVSLTVVISMFIIFKMRDIPYHPIIYPAVPIYHSLHPAAAMAVCRAFAPTQFTIPTDRPQLQARITDCILSCLAFRPFPSNQRLIAFHPSRACVPYNPICLDTAHRMPYIVHTQKPGTRVLWLFVSQMSRGGVRVPEEIEDLPGGRAIHFPPPIFFIFNRGSQSVRPTPPLQTGGKKRRESWQTCCRSFGALITRGSLLTLASSFCTVPVGRRLSHKTAMMTTAAMFGAT